MAKNAIIGLIDQPVLDEMGAVMQKPQAVNDAHGSNYDNIVSEKSWLRNGDATQKPGFDHTRKGK